MRYFCKTLSRLLALFLLLKRYANNRLWIHQWSSNVIIPSSGGDTVTSCDMLFSTRRCFRGKTPLACWLWSFTNTSTPVNEQKSTNTGQLSAWQKPGETHKRPSKEIHIQSTDVERATMVTLTACVAHRISITLMMHHSRNLISKCSLISQFQLYS